MMPGKLLQPGPLWLSYARALIVPKSRATPTAVPEGLRLGPQHINAGELARYNLLVGHHDTSVLPPLFPHMMAARLHGVLLSTPTFSMPLLGLIHTRSVIVELGPLPSTGELDVTATTSPFRSTDLGTECDLRTEAYHKGVLRWHATTTLLHRGRRKHRGPRVETSHEDPAGRMVLSCTWKLPTNTGRNYAGISGDYNPIHLWPLSAKVFGFKRPIAHGLFTLAKSLADMWDILPPTPRQLTARFHRPLMLPGEAVLSAYQAGESPGVHFCLHKLKQSKEIFISGSITPLPN